MHFNETVNEHRMPLTQDQRNAIKAWIRNSITDEAAQNLASDKKYPLGLSFAENVTGYKVYASCYGIQEQGFLRFMQRGGTTKDEIEIIRKDLPTSKIANTHVQALYRLLIEAQAGFPSLSQEEFDIFKLMPQSQEDLVKVHQLQKITDKGTDQYRTIFMNAPWDALRNIESRDTFMEIRNEALGLGPRKDPLTQLGEDLVFARSQTTQIGAHLSAAHKPLVTKLDQALANMQELHRQLSVNAKEKS